MKRIQVLLPHEHTVLLQELARRQGISISAMVRQLVEEGLTRHVEAQKARRARLSRRLQEEAHRLQSRYGDQFPTWTSEMLHRLREERLHGIVHS